MKRLKRLKLDRQLILLFSVIIAMTFVVIIGASAVYLDRYTNDLHSSLLDEVHHNIDSSIRATADQMASLTLAHAFWTELVDATERQDTQWVQINATKYLIDTPTYNATELLLYNTDNGYKELYGELPISIYQQLHSQVPEETQLKDPSSFLVQYNNKLYVLSLLALANTEHTSYHGYMVIGTRIDTSLMANLAVVFSRKATLTASLIPGTEIMTFSLAETDLKDWAQHRMAIALTNVTLIEDIQRHATYLVIFITLIVLSSFVILLLTLLRLSANFDKSIQGIQSITYHNYRQRLNLDYSKDFSELSDCINALAYALEERDDKIQKNYLELISILIKTLEEVDIYTRGHSERVSHYSVELAKAIGYTDLEIIRLSGLLHDVGKITVDTKILNKPSQLSDDEFSQIKLHPLTAYRILDLSEVFQPIKTIVKSHHEKMDGSGYPEGLMGIDIPLGARIVAIADVFDALTSARSYRQPMSVEEALQVIQNESGRHFDSELVDAFLPIAASMYYSWSSLQEAPSLEELHL